LVSPGVDGARLFGLLPHDAERRRPRQRADPQPEKVALFSLNYLPDSSEVADMATPRMFNESGYAGVGFSLGCGVNVDVAKTRLLGSLGEYFWSGVAATAFWIDPKEELTVVFITKVIGSEVCLTLHRDFRTLVYSATESFASSPALAWSPEKLELAQWSRFRLHSIDPATSPTRQAEWQ
jgi:CubicO group peptidase (beta-lactamase class C family)